MPKGNPTGCVIDDSTDNDIMFPKKFGRGFDPGQRTRDKNLLPQVEVVLDENGVAEKTKILVHPVASKKGVAGPPREFKIIPRSEWDARKQHKSLDQNGQGYCWMYSNVAAIMYKRAAANQPYKRLSAHAGACKVKNFRDEGGWCGQSMKFLIDNGIPETKFWPEKSMNRSYNTPETWANAKLHRPTEYCFDVSRAIYDQEMATDLIATFLFLNMPLALDFNWWGHSVCAIEWTRIESGSWGPTIHNSWTDSWGDEGLSTLQGNRAHADGATGICEVTAAA
jgi:hypothetical protein